MADQTTPEAGSQLLMAVRHAEKAAQYIDRMDGRMSKDMADRYFDLHLRLSEQHRVIAETALGGDQ